MAEKISVLRPGLLVSLSTRMKGNRSYVAEVIEAEHPIEDGGEQSKWETTRIIADKEEYEAAVKVRHQARNLITRVCSNSAFGLLCPESRQDELMAAVGEARKVIGDFNEEAKVTRMAVNVICGRVAQDDVEAVQAISGELRDLIEEMQNGLKSLDVKAVREACNKARSVGQMLTVDAKRKLDGAIESARAAAKDIVKAGETAAVELSEVAVATLDGARTAFLDMDFESDETEIAHPVEAARAVDFEPEAQPSDAEEVVSSAV